MGRGRLAAAAAVLAAAWCAPAAAAQERVVVSLVDALGEARVAAPGLEASSAAVRGRRGVSLQLPAGGGPGGPASLMTRSVGWGGFKERVTSRRAIMAPAGTRAAWTLTVPAGASLELGMLAWEPSGRGGEVLFEATVGLIGQEPRRLFSERVAARGSLLEERPRGLLRRWLGPGAAGPPGGRQRRLDLSPWGGRRVELALSTLPAAGVPAPAAPFWLDPLILAPAASPGGGVPSTVVLALVDSMTVEDFGRLASRGPFDRLRRSGTLMKGAWANGTWTRSSVVSMLSGLHPLETGLPLGDYAASLWAQEVFYAVSPPGLAALFRRGGWESAAFGDDVFISPTSELGVDLGFDLVGFEGRRGAGERAVDDALEFARSRPGRRLFILLHLPGAHRPVRPSARGWLALLARPDLWAAPATNAALLESGLELERFLQGLGEMGRGGGETCLALASDHGRPAAGRPREGGAKSELSASMLRVPLLFAGPGIRPGDELREAVDLLDVAPTLLALAGAGEGGAGGRGRSLAGLLTGKGPPPPKRIFAAGADGRLAEAWGGELAAREPEPARGPDGPPSDRQAYVLEFASREGPTASVSVRGDLTWAGIPEPLSGDLLERGRRRFAVKLAAGSRPRRVVFMVEPPGARCRLGLSSKGRVLEPREVALGPLAVRPPRQPFLAGGRRSGLLSAPHYPARLEDGAAATLELVPWQRLLGSSERRTLPGDLADLLASWGY